MPFIGRGIQKFLEGGVAACYGDNLDKNFKAIIQSFEESYMALGIPVTPKVHAVIHHVGQFRELKKRDLGPWSEQASEAVHSDFLKLWDRSL